MPIGNFIVIPAHAHALTSPLISKSHFLIHALHEILVVVFCFFFVFVFCCCFFSLVLDFFLFLWRGRVFF